MSDHHPPSSVASALAPRTDFTNHHNALTCPHCNPDGLILAPRTAETQPEQFAPCTSDDPIEHFWTAVRRGWEIEPREYFEHEAAAMGFRSPVEMAVHHMWKRHAKDWPRTAPAPLPDRLIEFLDVIIEEAGCVDHALLVREAKRVKAQLAEPRTAPAPSAEPQPEMDAYYVRMVDEITERHQPEGVGGDIEILLAIIKHLRETRTAPRCWFCARGKQPFKAGGVPCHHDSNQSIVTCPAVSPLPAQDATKERTD